MSGESDVRQIVSCSQRASTPWIERVPREHGTRAVRHVGDAAEMIARKEMSHTCDLFPMLEGTPRHGHAIACALLADFFVAPEHARVGLGDATFFLYFTHPALLAV